MQKLLENLSRTSIKLLRCEQIDYQNNDIDPIMITLYQIIIGQVDYHNTQ